MPLSHEQKRQVNDYLSESKKIKGFINHNILELSKLRLDMNRSNNGELKASLAFGRTLVNNQRKKAKGLTIEKIAEKLGVPFCSVRNYTRKADPKARTPEEKKALFEQRKQDGFWL